MDQLLERIQEAIEVCLDFETDDEQEISEFVGVQRIAIEV